MENNNETETTMSALSNLPNLPKLENLESRKSAKSLRGSGWAGLALAVFGVILLPDVAGAEEAETAYAVAEDTGSEIVITFTESKLIDNHDGVADQTETYTVTAETAGTYTMVVNTDDAYDGRTDATKQKNESVIVLVNYFETVVTEDLGDGESAARSSDPYLINLKEGDVVIGRHSANGDPTANSVNLASIVLTPYSVPVAPPVEVPEPVVEAPEPVEEILPELGEPVTIEQPVIEPDPEPAKPAKPTTYTEAELPYTGTMTNILLGIALGFFATGGMLLGVKNKLVTV